MARTVFCRKYQEYLEAMVLPPLPGAKGQKIIETVSKKAWQDWMALQTMLINEKRLNLMDPDHRSYLDGQREKFLDNKEHDHAEGYVPSPS